MKRSAIILAILLPALAAPAVTPAEEPVALTLDEAIAAALARNRELARGQLRVRGREVGVALARTAFDMTAGPVVQSSRMGDENQWTYGLQAAKTLPFGARVGASGTILDRGDSPAGGERAIAASISQPLFRRFGRQVAEEPVRLQIDLYRAERRHWEAQRADLVMGLVRTFESIARTDLHVAFETGYLERILRLATLVRARERQGRSTRVDVRRLELQGGEAEARLAALRERRDALSRELAETLGADLHATYRPAPPPTLALDLPEAEAAVAAASSNRLDLAQAEDNAVTARRQAAIAHRNRWPDLSVGLTLRHTRLDDPLPGIDDSRTDWFATASVDGYPWRAADRLTALQAEIDESSADAIVEIRREAVARDVLQTLAECRRAAAELGIAERNRKLAADGARLARRLYETGRGDAFSLSDAETQLARAETRLLEIRSAHRLSSYTLLHVTGALIEHPVELKPGWK